MKKLDIMVLIVFVVVVTILMVLGHCKYDIVIGIFAFAIAIVSGVILFLQSKNKKKETK